MQGGQRRSGRLEMALLPHRVKLEGAYDKMTKAREWCHQQWPNTHQATWYYGPLFASHTQSGIYHQTYSFQFREDAVLFELTWC